MASTRPRCGTAGPGTAGPGETVYRERLWPGPAIWALAPGAGLVLGIATAPVDLVLAGVLAVVVSVGLVGVLIRTSATVAIHDGVVVAGRARIAAADLGGARVVTPEAWAHAMGPGLDSRAYLCVRGWIRSGVQVEVSDPADPTPYWLVSSRNPAGLADALARVTSPQARASS